MDTVITWKEKETTVTINYGNAPYFYRLGESIPQRFETQAERDAELMEKLGCDKLPVPMLGGHNV